MYKYIYSERRTQQHFVLICKGYYVGYYVKYMQKYIPYVYGFYVLVSFQNSFSLYFYFAFCCHLILLLCVVWSNVTTRYQVKIIYMKTKPNGTKALP